jgi:hypothetical protein
MYKLERVTLNKFLLDNKIRHLTLDFTDDFHCRVEFKEFSEYKEIIYQLHSLANLIEDHYTHLQRNKNA